MIAPITLDYLETPTGTDTDYQVIGEVTIIPPLNKSDRESLTKEDNLTTSLYRASNTSNPSAQRRHVETIRERTRSNGNSKFPKRGARGVKNARPQFI